MKVLLNIWRPFVLSHVNDFGINHNLSHLSQRYPKLEFVTVTSPLLILLANLKYLFQRVAMRLPARRLARSWEWWRRFERLSWLPGGYVKRVGADIIVSHGSVPWPFPTGGAARVLFSNLESPLFYQRAGLWEQFPVELAVKRWTLSSADVVLTYQPASAQRLETEIPALRGRVWCIPAYDPYVEPVVEQDLLQKHHRSGPLRLAFVGSQSRRKGLPQLLQAWQLLSPSVRSRLEFTVVSTFRDGPVIPIPAEVRVVRGLLHTEVLALLQACHILVLPTWYDNFGRVLTEAMAKGCCVISSNQEPQDWILDYGTAGYLVDPAQPQELARVLTELVENRERRAQVALKGLCRFRERFYHDVVGSQLYEALHAAVVLRRRVRAEGAITRGKGVPSEEHRC